MSANESLRRELTVWRRIYEHQREQAKRDLAFAQEQISRLDAEYLRHFASADTLPKGGDAKQGSVQSKGSAVGEAETPTPHPSNQREPKEA